MKINKPKKKPVKFTRLKKPSLNNSKEDKLEAHKRKFEIFRLECINDLNDLRRLNKQLFDVVYYKRNRPSFIKRLKAKISKWFLHF